MKKIIACLSTLGVIAAMSIAAASPASATTMTIPVSKTCSATISSGNTYVGSSMSGYTTAVNHGCSSVQAAITYKGSGGVTTQTSAKKTTTATVTPGTTSIVQHQGFAWVSSKVTAGKTF